ncbi:MAG: enoyl-CoA hydratase/isomerase family protein [Bradyrhizobium sp.]|nr:enoyl-CoA hydratase/isomerase family protein [Bradyrhizobium sp.]
MSDEVLSRIDDHIGYVSLNRPDARNAVYPELLDHVIAAIKAFDADDEVRAIVFTGVGEAFCAGADRAKFLMTLPGKSIQAIQQDIYRRFMGVAQALRLASKPTIAAVNGAAVGAGCEFAINCDFRLATPSAMFWENWIDIGAVPPLGGMFLLPRLVGLERANDMILRARRVSADEALAWGLVSDVIPHQAFEAGVHKFAQSLARRSPKAMAIARAGLRRGLESTMSAEWDYNLQAQGILLAGPDFAEAMSAMAENRQPRF